MSSRALILAAVMFLIGGFAAIRAQAENLDAGKSPSQLFAGTCSECHKSSRGLLKRVPAASLPGFLRQHYTTSGQMASVLSAYLISNGAADKRLSGGQPRPGTDAKPDAGPRQAARPDAGYQHALTELTDFDPVACRFTDTWWEQDQPGQRHTQTGRCYTPADFRLLLEGTGLTLAAACVAGAPIDLSAPHTGHAGLLLKSHEWTAVLAA